VAETLAEELLLLAYDIRGKCRLTPAELDCGVGGALLSDLRLAGRLTVVGDALAVAEDTPVGDPILDGVLADIRAEPGTTPREWVDRLRGPRPGERLLARMAGRGQVEVDLHRTLGVFSETRYPVRDIVGLWEAQHRVVGAVTTRSGADPRTLALGALVTAAGLGKALFSTSGNWRALRARMRAMTADDWAAGAVREVLAGERKSVLV
jgi:hypothetical protein